MRHTCHDPATDGSLTLSVGEPDAARRFVAEPGTPTRSIAWHRGRAQTLRVGHPAPATVDALLAAGYTTANVVDANVVDIVITIGDKIITNFLHGITQVPIDFPLAPALETTAA